MQKIATADIVIVGGGIAGLWLLNRLRQQGLSVILLESGAIGGGQTGKSQGIIHGGMKYALQGLLTKDAQAMSDMPKVWRDCLAGSGELDLSHVKILSQHQYLWSPQKFASKLTGFLAGATLSSKVAGLAKNDYPLAFQHPQFKGEVSTLGEIVLDVHSLMRELVKNNQDAIFKIEPLCENELQFDEDNNLKSATVYLSGQALDIHAQRFIFAAGAGNEFFCKKLPAAQVAMQRRPLHMVLVKTPFELPLYAHCLGFGNRPRLTITTHKMHDGSYVWYLGGALSEEGVEKDSATQIKAAKKELASLFPWLDFSGAQYQTFKIDRAEPLQKNLLKPESSYFKAIANVLVAWPTKLALAPKLAADIINCLTVQGIKPKFCELRELRAWPMPPIAIPVWEEMFCKIDA